MMKPNVGLTVFTSSPMTFFTMVVLPALSRPLRRFSFIHGLSVVDDTHNMRMRISLSFRRAFRKMDNML